MNEHDKLKNILDLKHNVLTVKAGTFYALAFSSLPTIYFGLKNTHTHILLTIGISTLFAAIFFRLGTKHFMECKEIYTQIEEL